MRTFIFPRKIYYERGENSKGDGISKTTCPYGGSTENGTLIKGVFGEGSKVGGLACNNCLYNRGTEWHYVKCKRRKK